MKSYDIIILIWSTSRQNHHNAFATSMNIDQPAHPLSLIRIHAVRLPTLVTSSETDCEHHGSWSDYADAQAGLDRCWSQSHYVGFVMARLIWTNKQIMQYEIMQWYFIICKMNNIKIRIKFAFLSYLQCLPTPKDQILSNNTLTSWRVANKFKHT
jgi:hypothetical protein